MRPCIGPSRKIKIFCCDLFYVPISWVLGNVGAAVLMVSLDFYSGWPLWWRKSQKTHFFFRFSNAPVFCPLICFQWHLPLVLVILQLCWLISCMWWGPASLSFNECLFFEEVGCKWGDLCDHFLALGRFLHDDVFVPAIETCQYKAFHFNKSLPHAAASCEQDIDAVASRIGGVECVYIGRKWMKICQWLWHSVIVATTSTWTTTITTTMKSMQWCSVRNDRVWFNACQWHFNWCLLLTMGIHWWHQCFTFPSISFKVLLIVTH